MGETIGILGGTFNPPHLGHLIMAAEAREQLGLDRVVLMPVAVAPHKDADGDPGAATRLALCRAAVADIETLGVCDLEIERGGTSYTADTLREIRTRCPQAELTFVVGADQAHVLPAWREPEEVLSLATLAVAERQGVARDDVAARLRGLAGAQRVRFFDMPRVDISSSAVRRRVAAGRGVAHLVGRPVAELIAAGGLYGPAVAAPITPGGT